MNSGISQAELDYILEGCNLGIRNDGRENNDHRIVYFEDNVFPHVNGSARVKISDSVEVICGVKAEIRESTELVGCLEFSIDISPSCNPKIDDRKLAEYSAQLTSTLQEIMSGSKCIDLTALVIVPKSYVWSIYVDVMVLQMNGNPLDACSIASYIALRSTKIPKLNLIKMEGTSQQIVDFDVVGDLAQGVSLPLLQVPVCVTISKIGNSLVVDSDEGEWACAMSALVVAVNGQNQVCGVSKQLKGTFSFQDITQALQIAQGRASFIIGQIDQFLTSEQFKNDDKFACVIPSRMGMIV